MTKKLRSPDRLVDCDDPPDWYDDSYHHQFINDEVVITFQGWERPLARDAIAHSIAEYEVFVRPGLELVTTVFEVYQPKYDRRSAYHILTKVVYDPLYEHARSERAAGFKSLQAFRLVMADIFHSRSAPESMKRIAYRSRVAMQQLLDSEEEPDASLSGHFPLSSGCTLVGHHRHRFVGRIEHRLERRLLSRR
jgi:hypothetical protein